ncbi:threonyl-tRNA synthetase editing domain-containing protein [bacterium]|nr:threonyl-tRNA synthetase editing domain-containing protein [bacterium]
MRTLLFHCKKYRIAIDKLANRPEDITPEEIREREQSIANSVVAMVTVEIGDGEEKAEQISAEIEKMCKDVGESSIVILPFAHLSNQLATSGEAIKILDAIVTKLQGKFSVIRSHFGSHKELLIDIYGHPGNVRYRE